MSHHVQDLPIDSRMRSEKHTSSNALTRKERMLRALRREPVDHLPYQTNFTGAMGRRLAEHFGISFGSREDIEGLKERLCGMMCG